MPTKSYINKKYLKDLYNKGGADLVKEKLSRIETLIFTGETGKVMDMISSNNMEALNEYLSKI